MSEISVKFDKVDCDILERLLVDSRMPYQEIAKELIVSPGTIHVRLNKMKEAGIIQGSKVIVDFRKLGLEVTAFIGVNLNSAKDYQKVLKRMQTFPEVTDVHYTTGQYSMFVKIMVENTRALHDFLVDKLQHISEIHSTETFISLDNPINRDGKLPEDLD